MNRTIIVLLLMIMLFSVAPISGLASSIGLSSDLLEVTLPDDATITPGKIFDQYVISWEPLEDVYEYQFGGFREIEGSKDGKSAVYFEVVSGWFGPGEIQDGEGKSHSVSFAPFESRIPALAGEESEKDFTSLVNGLCEMSSDAMKYNEDLVIEDILGYYICVVIVPQSGKPIAQVIELPFELAE